MGDRPLKIERGLRPYGRLWMRDKVKEALSLPCRRCEAEPGQLCRAEFRGGHPTCALRFRAFVFGRRGRTEPVAAMELRELHDITWYCRHYLDTDGFRVLPKVRAKGGYALCAYLPGGVKITQEIELPLSSAKLDAFAIDAMRAGAL